jgi:hypothetical protein
MTFFDPSDQAAVIGNMYSLHLQSKGHNGKVNPECPFCKAFLMQPEDLPEGRPLESHTFYILDFSDGTTN